MVWCGEDGKTVSIVLSLACLLVHLDEEDKKQLELPTPNVGKDVKQQEPSHVAGGNAKWYRPSGRQFGGLLQN